MTHCIKAILFLLPFALTITNYGATGSHAEVTHTDTKHPTETHSDDTHADDAHHEEQEDHNTHLIDSISTEKTLQRRRNRPWVDGSLMQEYAPDWEQYKKTGVFGDLPLPGDNNTRRFDTTAAENRYIEKLSLNISDKERRNTMLEMAAMFERNNIKIKVASVYEKFLDTFDDDPLTPEIQMRLGFLYREMGAYYRALAKYYSVLSSSVAVEKEKLDLYTIISRKAQLEIADTYYMMGNYNEAIKSFGNLRKLELPRNDQAMVEFKYAYSQYLTENFKDVVTDLKAFIQKFPENKLIPESHFILANSYKKLDQTQDAIRETLVLLKKEHAKHEDNEKRAMWLYWKHRTGNQLANEFYEQGDYMNALRIYQAMAKLSQNPNWQWHVVYQLGLCYERLRMLPKAKQAYEHILEDPELPDGINFVMNDNLKSLREMAQWRLDHIKWLTDADAQLQTLFDPETL